jgi:hypothetical protein
MMKISNEGAQMSFRKRVSMTLGIGFLFFIVGGFCYFGIYYHANDEALEALKGNDTVKVLEIKEGFLFDGPGEYEALVFYPGAKVDERAYSNLLLDIAEGGVDCFMVKMPLHMAFTNRTAAIQIADKYKYQDWYLCGHSLGGAMVSACASMAPQKFKGMFMLASYPSEEIADDYKYLSFMGTKDTVVKRELYEKGKAFWPSLAKEIIIDGGNHSGYGDYGEQKGDGNAVITSAEQQEQVAAAILDEIAK